MGAGSVHYDRHDNACNAMPVTLDHRMDKQDKTHGHEHDNHRGFQQDTDGDSHGRKDYVTPSICFHELRLP